LTLAVARLENLLYPGRVCGYLEFMTVTAERVLAEIKALPPAELREVWQGLSLTLSEPATAPTLSAQRALQIVHSLYGRFAGGKSVVHLLQERARDRAREEDKLHRLSRKHA
jgi:hypothetical protein